MHFQTWADKAGNAPPLTDLTNELVFPDLNAPPFGGEGFQTNLIRPERTIFLDRRATMWPGDSDDADHVCSGGVPGVAA